MDGPPDTDLVIQAEVHAEPNINRRTSLRVIRVRGQAPKFLLGLPAPDAVLLASGHGVCQAFDLDRATITDGQRLPLSSGGHAGCYPTVPAQFLQVRREEDVLVGRRYFATAGSQVRPPAEPSLEEAATARHGRPHLARRERAEASARRAM
jgi:hypothetical protein